MAMMWRLLYSLFMKAAKMFSSGVNSARRVAGTWACASPGCCARGGALPLPAGCQTYQPALLGRHCWQQQAESFSLT